MDSVAVALSGAIVLVSFISGMTSGIAAPLFLWNVAHALGLALPYILYYVDVNTGEYRLIHLARESSDAIAQLVILASAGVLLTNAIVCLASLSFSAKQRPPLNGNQPPKPYPMTTAAAIWLVGLVVGIFLVANAFGSLAAGLSLLSTKVYTPIAGQTYILLPFIFSQVVVIVLAVEIVVGPPPSARRLLIVAALMIVTALTMLAIGSRSRALQVLLIPALAYATQLRLQSKITLGLVVTGLALVVSWIGLELRSAEPIISTQTFNFFDAIAGFSSSYAILDQLIVVEKFVDVNGIQLSRFLSDYTSTVIPRALWPDKPLAPPMELRWFLYGDTAGGVTPGYYGEFFYYFGPVGFFLGALLAGLVLWWLGRQLYWTVRAGRPSAIVFFWSFVVAVHAPRDSLFVVAFNILIGSIFIIAFDYIMSAGGRLVRKDKFWRRSSAKL